MHKFSRTDGPGKILEKVIPGIGMILENQNPVSADFKEVGPEPEDPLRRDIFEGVVFLIVLIFGLFLLGGILVSERRGASVLRVAAVVGARESRAVA